MERFLIREYVAHENPLVSERLSQHPPLLQELLAARGITTTEEAEKFLNPDYVRDTHDPFLLFREENSGL
ncbi:MAG: hypothetical protein AAB726_03390 [Patescibacteria group bacterium]